MEFSYKRQGLFVSDNGTCGGNTAGWGLVIQGTLQGVEDTHIPNITERTRKWAEHFRYSVQGTELLQQRQEKLGLPLHHLIQDVMT